MNDTQTAASNAKQKHLLIADVGIGLLILNAASALVALIWIYLSIRLAALVIIFGAFGLFMCAMWRPRLGPLFLFFFILAGYEAIVLEEYIVATLGAAARDVQVADVLEHSDASIITFADGALRADKYGVSSMTTKTGDSRAGASFSYVAPYVRKDWTEKTPVTIWAACHLTDAGTTGTIRSDVRACGDFGVSTHTAVAVPESGFFRAIDNAVETHKLKVAEDALLLQFVPDPAAYIYEKQHLTIWVPAILNGLFVLTILIIQLLKRRKAAG